MALLLYVKHVRHVVSHFSNVSYFADLHWLIWSFLIASAASTNIRLQRSNAIDSRQPQSFASVFDWLPSSQHWGTEVMNYYNIWIKDFSQTTKHPQRQKYFGCDDFMHMVYLLCICILCDIKRKKFFFLQNGRSLHLEHPVPVDNNNKRGVWGSWI